MEGLRPRTGRTGHRSSRERPGSDPDSPEPATGARLTPWRSAISSRRGRPRCRPRSSPRSPSRSSTTAAQTSADLRGVLARLKEICRTSSDALLFTASGTGAMESAVANLCGPGARVVVVSAGAFGERWVEIADRYGCEVVPLRYQWGEVPAATDLEALLAETGVRAVFLPHSETSTGVVSDLHAFAEAVPRAHVVVDAVSCLGAVPLEMDAWGIDVVVLRLAEGVDDAARPRHRSGLRRRLEPRSGVAPLLLRLGAERKAQDVLDAPFTPAISLVRALNVALGLLLDEGLEAAFDRHVRLGRASRRAEGDGAGAVLARR